MFLNKHHTKFSYWRAAVGFVVSAIACALLMFSGADIAIHNFAIGYQNGIWTGLSEIGGTYFWGIGLSVALILSGIWFHKFLRKSILITLSVAGARAFSGILKIAFGRGRPVLFDEYGTADYAHWTIYNDLFHSFPSGHATAVFAGFVMVGLFFPRIKWATWTMAILVGASRVVVGAHYASDVVAGAFIGALAADIIYAKFHRRSATNPLPEL